MLQCYKDMLYFLIRMIILGFIDCLFEWNLNYENICYIQLFLEWMLVKSVIL